MSFRTADVFLPGAEPLGSVISAESELEGTVIDLSDSGYRSQVFAIVEVVRREVVVLPVEKLRLLEPVDPSQ